MPASKGSIKKNKNLNSRNDVLNFNEEFKDAKLESFEAIMEYRGARYKISGNIIPDEIEQPNLSKREKQVLQALSNGLTPDQIALELGITVRTIRKYLTNLQEKFETNSRDQLMARAGFISLCRPYPSFPADSKKSRLL